eukprot:3165126-Pleurochrysis_carterae.AAC.1
MAARLLESNRMRDLHILSPLFTTHQAGAEELAATAFVRRSLHEKPSRQESLVVVAMPVAAYF